MDSRSSLTPSLVPTIQTDHFLLGFSVDLKSDELELIDKIGTGGYGEVWRGTYRGSDVAIKQFHAKILSPEEKAEIRSEAAIMGSLLSSHLVRLRGLCFKDQFYCLVMEYMPGGDLRRRLATERSLSTEEDEKDLPWPVRYRIAHDVTLGLRELHEHVPPIFHRDLDSQNVLLDNLLRAKLCDFGMASLKSTVKEGKQPFGKIPWAAPELLNPSGEKLKNDDDFERALTHMLDSKTITYTTAADIYSLGMLFWELATRELPYATSNFLKVLRLLLMEGKRERDRIPASCPPEFAQLIQSCCAEQPEKRPTAKRVEAYLKALCDRPLIEAISRGEKKAVEKFLQENFSPNTQMIDSETGLPVSLLYAAAKAGHDTVVECLLKHKATVKRGRKDGATPLHVAKFNNHEKIVTLLITAKSDVSLASFDVMPLHSAIEKDQTEKVKLLIEQKAKVNAKEEEKGATPLHLAVERDQGDIAKFLIAQKAEVNAKNNLGRTPLHQAIEKGQSNMARFLIEKKAEVNIESKGNATPLHAAAAHGQIDIAKLLIEKKANINAKNILGKTPIHQAVQENQREMTKFLIEQKAEINVKDNLDNMPIYQAVQQGQNDVARFMIRKKIEVNTKNKEGATLLHIAALNGKIDTAKLLVKHKAEINAKDNLGNVPLHLTAMLHNRVDMVKFLIERKAEVNKENNKGATALYIAAQEGQEETVKLLLKSRADINKKCGAWSIGLFGKTPLEIAEEKRHIQVVKVLRQRS